MDMIRQVDMTRQAATTLGSAISADFETISHWAGERGMTFKTWEDLPAVNERRERLRQPLFKRELPRHSSS
jgi:hypothetical protein